MITLRMLAVRPSTSDVLAAACGGLLGCWYEGRRHGGVNRPCVLRIVVGSGVGVALCAVWVVVLLRSTLSLFPWKDVLTLLSLLCAGLPVGSLLLSVVRACSLA